MFQKENKEFAEQGVETTQRKLDEGLYAGVKKKAAEAFVKADTREEERSWRSWESFRSWAAIGISLLALIVSSLVAIYK